MRRFALRLFSLFLSFCLMVPHSAYALREQQEEAPIQLVGLEQALQATPRRPVPPGTSFDSNTTGLEETPITKAMAEATDIVRGWEGLSEPQKNRVIADLAVQRYTLEKHGRHRGLVLNPSQQKRASFVRFPLKVEAPPNSAKRMEVRERGRQREVLEKLGIVLAGAGEGSRLLEKAIELGLLPSDALQKYTKPTVPVMPVTGKPLLFYVLEALADVAETYGVPLPVRLVLHPEVGSRVEEAIRANDNFGLKHLEVVFQAMNPALDSTGRVMLRPDGTIVFNPDGTGGVMEAALRDNGAEWMEDILGPGARVALIYPDMRVEPEFIELAAGASESFSRMGVGYAYPQERKADNKDPTSNHAYTLGTFSVVSSPEAGPQETGTIVEYAERKNVEGLVDAIREVEGAFEEAEGELKEEKRSELPRANSGMSVRPLAGLLEEVQRLEPHIQRNKKIPGVGEGNKLELFATDLPTDGVLSMEEIIPIKDPEKLRRVRDDGINIERKLAEQMGFDLGDDPNTRMEFHVAMHRSGRLIVGKNVRVKGPVGMYVAPNGVWLYPTPQPGQPWEPFDPKTAIHLFEPIPGEPVVIPDNAVFSADGVTSAGLEETVGTRVVVVSAQAAKGTGLEELAGRPLRVGANRLLILPEEAGLEELSSWTTDLLAVSPSVVVLVGSPADFSGVLAMLKDLVSVRIVEQTGTTLLELVRQIFANLTGLEENAVSDDQLAGFEEALGLSLYQ